MKNIVVLYKTEDDELYCQQISEKGILFIEGDETGEDMHWEDGGTITLDDLEEILDKEV